MTELLRSTNPNNLAIELQNSGYDIVYIEFDDPTAPIQRNAYLLEDIITRINGFRKEGDEPLTVVGVSMGGLIARYALREMEVLGKPHHTDRFITFDTPHLGANIPLGFQYFFNSIASDRQFFFVQQIHQGAKILNSAAAQQMLVATTGNGQAHHAFMNELNNLGNGGFPVQTRNVAISNGSLTGNGQYFGPGATLLDINGNSVTTIKKKLWKRLGFIFSIVLQTRYLVDIEVNALPSSGKSVIYKGRILVMILGVPVYVKYEQVSITASPSMPYDSAPGGKYDLTDIIGAIDPVVDFVNISMITEFCFVSTVSALNLTAPFSTNLYYNVNANNVVNTGKTNFDRIAGPISSPTPTNPKTYNEVHTAFASSNNVLLYNELINNVKHSLITSSTYYLNQSYNFGAGTINRLGNIQVNGNSTILSVNANQPIDFITSSNPNPIAGSSFLVSVNGAANCGGHAIVRIQNEASLVLGDASTGNMGILEIRDEAAVEINATGILTINEHSELHIKAGATLIIRAGAILNLNGKITIDPGAYYCIEAGANVNTGLNGILTISSSALSGANPVINLITNNCQIPIACPGQPANVTNEALQFDGVDDFVDVPEINGSLNLGQGDFTFEAFIKSDYVGTAPVLQMILTKRNGFDSNGRMDGFMWGIYRDGTMFAQLNDVPNLGYNNGPNLLDGNCHFVALTRQGSIITFYVDGNITHQTSIAGRDISSPASLRIGHNHISNVPFKGVIGEVRIWNAVVVPSSFPVNPAASNLIAYWDMNGASSYTLTDLSGQGNMGILGSTLVCDDNDPTWVNQNSLSCSAVGGNFRVSSMASINNSGINVDTIINARINVYPNPFSGEIKINFSGLGENVRVKVRNENGFEVFTKENYMSDEPLVLGDAFPQGFYFMEITSSTQSKYVKLIKVAK